MQGMVVVGLIVVEVKYRSRSLGQGTCTCQASAMRCTMQGLVVVGLIFEEKPNINIKCVSHWSVQYRSRSPGQGHVNLTPFNSVHQGEAQCKVWWL